MLQAFVGGLAQVFTATTFTLMMVGIVIGFAVGILPGLGGPVTLALMLPFIFKMEAVEAFAFLLGMSAVTATTGDITSILFGIPGEAITASTIVDGHPMAKKGEAGRALGASLMSSLVGAVFGAFALALAIPIVRPLVLAIGSPEFFMLALLGVTFLASLSGTAVIRGLTAAALGLMLATVGLDPISGIERFTFDSLYLWDGIKLVPVTLGLFAIPEIIELSVKGSSISEEKVETLGGVMEGVKDTFRHWGLVLRCSAIGTYIGIIPGMGGAVSQWVAYAHAVQTSPDKERFGKGAVEGVLGPGAANNSNLGGALVPTIAFGVPGSVTMAILLGAFIIQGLVPGPPMLEPASRGGHLDLTFSFVWIVVVSNIITVSICFIFLKQLARITEVRGSLVLPFLLVLIYLGGFAQNNAFEDLIVVLAFGLVGWIMVQLDWPRPPLLLGLVLGSLAEKNLFLATDNYGWGWVGFPGVLVIGAIILAGILYPIYQRRREARRQAAGAVSTPIPVAVPEMEAAEAPKGLTVWHIAFTAVLLAGFAWGVWEARDWGYRASLFPWVIGFPGIVLCLAQLEIDVMGFLRQRKEAVAAAGADPLVIRRTVTIVGWILGFFASIWLFGFPITVPLCTFLFLKVGAGEKWPISIILTLLAWAGFYAVFEYSLSLPFPPGTLIEMFTG
ncbi:MAG: tripartite tricarboxylate transporter permease [Deltaproteobacteria bacterium]|nr:tripartite tricarboxylate transporter permease [Deltaproteobacteria bacterium]